MHLKSLIFYLTLIVLSKQSSQQDYDDSTVEDSDEELPITPKPVVRKGEISEKSTIYETTKISADKGSDVVLECSPEYGKQAKWLVQPTYGLSITTTSDGISSLSILNVAHDHTYECRRSDNIVRRFVLTVNGPYATIVSHSDFVRNGTNVPFSCVVRSLLPVTSAYLQVNGVFTTEKYVANWESKRRICANNDYNRTDCFEETTFQFIVYVTANGFYTCGNEEVESIGHTVEVIENEPIIYEATKICSLSYVQQKIVQFAIEALEKHGLTHDAATDVREKCMDAFKRSNAWNCIMGKDNFKHSLSPDINGDEYASFKFSLGSIFFAVFRTNK
ncbi:uncharacterized protein LOC119072756 [Bradysia coprophila]|uniref:uncharacterized protein LOC119072756 n=1 Tax=Bradysia coprophila TaxID=38358 RepID=UPI00187D8C75|nr:uncharacterized protein LOC119072756 [Bradysia coprophila]